MILRTATTDHVEEFATVSEDGVAPSSEVSVTLISEDGSSATTEVSVTAGSEDGPTAVSEVSVTATSEEGATATSEAPTKSPNPPISKSPNSGDYRPQLDGLRAVAVIAVAWSHWERPYQFGIPFGAGVHLFYVLSGFLITGILLRVREQHERGHGLAAFYIRRALRIFPAFYVTLVLAWWADLPLVRESFIWHVTYLSNVYTLVRGEWPGLISHFWSLAVEEQFYLVWPWLIVFAPQRWLLPGIVTAIVVAPAFRWWMATLGYAESMHAVLTPGCLDSLGVGALLALNQQSTVDGRRSPAAKKALIAIGLPGYIGALLLEALGIRIGFVIAIKQTLQALVFGWIVLRAAEGFGGLTGRMLSAAPIVYIGRISYGVYLAHGFAGAIAATMFLAAGIGWPIPEPWRLLVLCGVTVGAAALSWHVMERPINAMKRCGALPVEAKRELTEPAARVKRVVRVAIRRGRLEDRRTRPWRERWIEIDVVEQVQHVDTELEVGVAAEPESFRHVRCQRAQRTARESTTSAARNRRP